MKFFFFVTGIAVFKLCRKLWRLEHGYGGVFGYSRGDDLRRSIIQKLKVVVSFGEKTSHH